MKKRHGVRWGGKGPKAGIPEGPMTGIPKYAMPAMPTMPKMPTMPAMPAVPSGKALAASGIAQAKAAIPSVPQAADIFGKVKGALDSAFAEHEMMKPNKMMYRMAPTKPKNKAGWGYKR